MLKIHFFNVGEGDAILMEYEDGSSPFRVLIDTGRLNLTSSEGSLRHPAHHYLRKMDINFIDALILTHSHKDHIGDLPEILKTVRFGRVYSSWFPPEPGARSCLINSELKAARELPEDLNGLAVSMEIAEKKGTKKVLLTEDLEISPGKIYGSILIRMPQRESLEFRNRVYDSLFKGETVPEEDVWRASKSRNENSLRILVKYAERIIALDGDYYAVKAENEPQIRCDILKAAHHGDRKSMTEKLAAMQRPSYTVVSCGREYVEKKDRPSRTAMDFLVKYGSKIFYTDCFADENEKPVFHEEILISIDKTGLIRITE